MLENFCTEQVKKLKKATSFDEGHPDFISTKDFIYSFRVKCQITDEINRMLFSDEACRYKAMHKVNFYSQVKKVIIRCGGTDKAFNLRIFMDLILELRVKLNITKEGLGPEKIMREINFGLENAKNHHKDSSYGDIDDKDDFAGSSGGLGGEQPTVEQIKQ